MAVMMGPLLVHELAALIDSVTTPSPGAVAAFGGEGIFDPQLAEWGHAALGLRYLAHEADEREAFVSDVDQCRRTAARALADGRPLSRIGVLRRNELTTVVVCGDGAMTVMPAPDGWFIVAVDVDADPMSAYLALEPALTDDTTLVAQRWEGSVERAVVCASGQRLAEHSDAWRVRAVGGWSAFLAGLVDWSWT